MSPSQSDSSNNTDVYTAVVQLTGFECGSVLHSKVIAVATLTYIQLTGFECGSVLHSKVICSNTAVVQLTGFECGSVLHSKVIAVAILMYTAVVQLTGFECGSVLLQGLRVQCTALQGDSCSNIDVYSCGAAYRV